MKAFRDLHVHSCFCDGHNTPEELVLFALEKGLGGLGICTHAYFSQEEGYCIPLEKYGEFQGEIARLKEKYAGRIELLCGVEQEYFSEADTSGFDYIIGSAHYVKVGGEYVSVDARPELFEEGCRKHFGGDYYALAQAYFETVSDVVEKTHCDFIGHFDIVSKYNCGDSHFSESDPRYVSAWKAAADRLLAYNIPFEINTGGVFRGWRDLPYPAPPILDYLRQHGGRFLLSSDAHKKESIGYLFEENAGLL